MGAGMPGKVEALMSHNLEKVKKVGAKKIVFTCPSCYHTWKNFYKPEAEILSTSEYLENLLMQNRLLLKEINASVTYHDPCDLGRNSGIYDSPRKVLKAIPGLRLVELPNNRQLSVCCGGGGEIRIGYRRRFRTRL